MTAGPAGDWGRVRLVGNGVWEWGLPFPRESFPQAWAGTGWQCSSPMADGESELCWGLWSKHACLGVLRGENPTLCSWAAGVGLQGEDHPPGTSLWSSLISCSPPSSPQVLTPNKARAELELWSGSPWTAGDTAQSLGVHVYMCVDAQVCAQHACVIMSVCPLPCLHVHCVYAPVWVSVQTLIYHFQAMCLWTTPLCFIFLINGTNDDAHSTGFL